VFLHVYSCAFPSVPLLSPVPWALNIVWVSVSVYKYIYVFLFQAREVENIIEEHCYNHDHLLQQQQRQQQGPPDVNVDATGDSDDEECCSLLQLDLTVLSIHLPEIQEVDTLAIAKHKAILAAQLVNGPCFIEDTSLEFHALGGMPGPYIKWFQETLKSEGTTNIGSFTIHKNTHYIYLTQIMSGELFYFTLSLNTLFFPFGSLSLYTPII
jgi:Ham1 family